MGTSSRRGSSPLRSAGYQKSQRNFPPADIFVVAAISVSGANLNTVRRSRQSRSSGSTSASYKDLNSSLAASLGATHFNESDGHEVDNAADGEISSIQDYRNVLYLPLADLYSISPQARCFAGCIRRLGYQKPCSLCCGGYVHVSYESIPKTRPGGSAL